MKSWLFSFLIVLLSLSLGCQKKADGSTAATADSATVKLEDLPIPPPLPTESGDSLSMLELTHEILTLAAAKDYATLATQIHPTLGIRFSPYTYVDKAEHKHFTADEFREQVTKGAQKKVLWGTSDPLGEPIKLTVEGYFKEFAYDKNYLQEGRMGYNATIGRSTIVNNIQETYPEAIFVEAYWVPQDEEKAPYEWGSIRLVYEKYQDQYYLVAWVHDAWST